MIQWLGGFLLVGLGTLATYLYIHLGAYKEVTVRIETYPDLYLVGRSHLGPYHKIGDLLQSLESSAKRLGLDCSVPFGQFLDNPQPPDSDRLRSLVGCALYAKPDEEIEKQLDAKLVYLASGRYVFGKFQGSPAIGPFVVYPKLKKEAEKQRLLIGDWALELYEMSRTGEITTSYLLPIAD